MVSWLKFILNDDILKRVDNIYIKKKQELRLMKWVFFTQYLKGNGNRWIEYKRTAKREEGRNEVCHKRHFMGVSGL